MKQLPYNKGQNPMEVAEAFCSREQIHKGNTEQIRQFIVQNSGGGGGAAPPPPQPSAGYSSAPSEPESTMFPLHTPFTFKDGKFEALEKKILEFNDQVDESLRLPPVDIDHLKTAIEILKTNSMSKQLRDCQREIILDKLGAWPLDKLFPVADLWRLYLVHPQSCEIFKGSDRGAAFIAKIVGLVIKDVNTPLALCCTRFLANMFIHQTNRYALFDKRDYLLEKLEPAFKSTNKHTKVACTSILVNIAIVLHEQSMPPKKWDSNCAQTVARMALSFLSSAMPDDADSQSRAFLAIGSLLPRDKRNGSAITEQCKQAGLHTKLIDLEAKVGSNYTSEVRRLLG